MFAVEAGLLATDKEEDAVKSLVMPRTKRVKDCEGHGGDGDHHFFLAETRTPGIGWRVHGMSGVECGGPANKRNGRRLLRVHGIGEFL